MRAPVLEMPKLAKSLSALLKSISPVEPAAKMVSPATTMGPVCVIWLPGIVAVFTTPGAFTRRDPVSVIPGRVTEGAFWKYKLTSLKVPTDVRPVRTEADALMLRR